MITRAQLIRAIDQVRDGAGPHDAETIVTTAAQGLLDVHALLTQLSAEVQCADARAVCARALGQILTTLDQPTLPFRST